MSHPGDRQEGKSQDQSDPIRAMASEGSAPAAVRSRYEITCPFFGISLRLLMPFRNFSGQLILLQRLTASCAPFGRPPSSTTAPWRSVIASWTSGLGWWTRWCRQRGAGDRISPRAAEHPPAPARPSCAWWRWLARVSTNYLLDQQIAALERRFVEGGGYSEQLAAARIAARRRQQQRPSTPEVASPACPLCGEPMARRTARKGAQAGSQFWGCTAYPECRGTRPVDESVESHRSDGSLGSTQTW